VTPGVFLPEMECLEAADDFLDAVEIPEDLFVAQDFCAYCEEPAQRCGCVATQNSRWGGIPRLSRIPSDFSAWGVEMDSGAGWEENSDEGDDLDERDW
jgi:hypothetical protein